MVIANGSGIIIESKYLIEYKTASSDSIDQSEQYIQKGFSNLNCAINTYLDMITCPDIQSIRFVEEILLNGKSMKDFVSERTDIAKIKSNISKALQDEISKQNRRLGALEKELKLYQDFVEQYHDMDDFNKFIA